MLARTRDIDMTVRRLVYGSILLSHAELPDDAMPGAAHPRALTIAQREQIVRNGLGDREPAVRAAAGKLVGAWVDVVSVETKKDAILEDLLAFSAPLTSAKARLWRTRYLACLSRELIYLTRSSLMVRTFALISSPLGP